MAQDPKNDLQRYLQQSRDALLWKLDGLSEYDVRRPMTPTSTNLLGMVKHVASVASGYFGEVFGRPADIELPWFDRYEMHADMWVPADETRAYIVDIWNRAWDHADKTISELPLDAVGSVPWWPEDRRQVTLHQILIHMIAEVNRHAGHADIIRETIDGSAGHRADSSNLPSSEEAGWEELYRKVDAAAREARG